MGIIDSSIANLLTKLRSLVSWRGGSISDVSREYWMPDDSCRMCYECDLRFSVLNRRHHCRSCGRVFCSKCMQDSGNISSPAEDKEQFKYCKFCFQAIVQEAKAEISKKLDIVMSSGQSFEYGQEKYSSNKPLQIERLAQFLESQGGSSSSGGPSSCATSSVDPRSPLSLRCSTARSDEEDAEGMRKHVLSPTNEFVQDASDVDTSSTHTRNEFYNFKSMASSPLDSPSLMTSSLNRPDFSLQPDRVGSPSFLNEQLPNQDTSGSLRRTDMSSEDLETTCNYTDASIFQSQNHVVRQHLDFENNGLIWFPPPPEDEGSDVEKGYFEYDDEDEEVGESGPVFLSSDVSGDTFSSEVKPSMGQKEPLRVVVHGHFRALVLQLLRGEGLYDENEIRGVEWLEPVASLAWQAANFMKPDTSREGSMDPLDYVKVKCVPSGDPCESTFIRGVVCTKNVKHKRMTSQYRNARLLLLGGSLEYQRVPNQLASMDTLLQQEIEHLKMTVGKIEAHHPNILLVEKSVSSYAQEYLLAKEISLVLNVKRPLMERIARCTGAHIIPSIDNLASARLGHCEIFRLEKVDETSVSNQQNKKLRKTLMFFEGCPRRLGCTILLRGKSLEELKKVKHVVQYAVFAAYHLSLETSFLADEGATIPLKPSAVVERDGKNDSGICRVSSPSVSHYKAMSHEHQEQSTLIKLGDSNLVQNSGVSKGKDLFDSDLGDWESPNECFDISSILVSDTVTSSGLQWGNVLNSPFLSSELSPVEASIQDEVSSKYQGPSGHVFDTQDYDLPSEYFSATDNNQSILVSFSSRCVLKGTLCERSQLVRIKFYGNFDKPLGRFLRDDVFDQRSLCHSCNEPLEAHVRCYTHQQGSLTINVKSIPSLRLPGEHDGKIWMWHRCLKCAHADGIPPASRRVVMSDAAWGLSFGKFLELSFSNHATANRVASCGHSLQKDCLRFYGFGHMVAFFRYTPIDILSVHLPPLVLGFNGHHEQDWIQREAIEVTKNMEFMYAEVFDILQGIAQKLSATGFETLKACTFNSHINELKDLLKKERDEYEVLLQLASREDLNLDSVAWDILELNRLRRCLLIDSYMWDRRLSLLDSFLKSKSPSTVAEPLPTETNFKPSIFSENLMEQGSLRDDDEGKFQVSEPISPISSECVKIEVPPEAEDVYGCNDYIESNSMEKLPSPPSNLSDKIDLAWTGSDCSSELETAAASPTKCLENLHHRRVMAPVRVHSFDSGLRFHDKVHKVLSPASLHLFSVRSFHASGDFGSLVHDPLSNRIRAYTQVSPMATQNLNFLFSHTPLYISLTSRMVSDGARLLLPLTGSNNVVIAVYDNEPTTIISYALSSKEYMDYVSDEIEVHEDWNEKEYGREDLERTSSHQHASSNFSAWQSFSAMDSEEVLSRSYGVYGSEDASLLRGAQIFPDSKRMPHVRVSFGDESSFPLGKAKFSVTCYFAKQFDALRKKCCIKDVDFLRSLSRCRRWSAQGGKSNVYFAKTLDERFIIKQVTKTELESFEEFAPQYFKYLMDSLSTGSPTCLAKVLGIYQVTVKHWKGGKEVKMDLMVMENLFFRKNISRIYDLKGSARSRYNSDTTGGNKVLLDLNLLETLRTNPIFLASNAKRRLERAVWNDTSFLASIGVMDYSLLVGVDEEKKELVVGIIDFMRQYTWDKHLETWVKASGILGGPKNASPTVISPKQYKKRFRKAMSTYFWTVPDQWTP